MSALRKKLGRIIRNTFLLKFIHLFGFCRDYLKTFSGNRRFLRANPDFKPPPMALMYQTCNHNNYEYYVRSGLEDAAIVYGQLKEFIGPECFRICEWGCGTGRVIRHVKKLHGRDNLELYGTDVNSRSVSWLKSSIDGVRFHTNNLTPPLIYEDDFFDAMYSISVFTHLSERVSFEWIGEIHRVLKPGGVFVSTFHGDNFKNLLSGDELARFESGGLVIRSNVKEGSSLYAAFHPDAFLRNELFEDFEILRVVATPSPHLQQSMWLVRKK